MSTIELSEVTKRYRTTVALDHVSAQVGTGITGLLGPNGAGKTTLLRLVATALAPDGGTVRLLGHDPATSAGRLVVRRSLGYVPQDPGFHARFTAFDFVDYVAILKEMTDRDQRRAEVRRVLELVGLVDDMHKRIGALSGGMRRRVAVAQALVGEPDLLVMDEPTAGLDPEQRLRFREVISRNAAERTVLLSTHLTEDVAALCQRVIVLHDGRIHFDGTPPAFAETAAGRVWVADERDPRARLSWRSGEGIHRHIGDPPAGAELVAPTIEDAYLLTVGDRARQEVAA